MVGLLPLRSIGVLVSGPFCDVFPHPEAITFNPSLNVIQYWKLPRQVELTLAHRITTCSSYYIKLNKSDETIGHTNNIQIINKDI